MINNEDIDVNHTTAAGNEHFQQAITFLNSTGDVTLTWDEQNEERILAMVEEKMKAGFSFFVLKPRILGIPGNSKKRLKSIEQAKKAGHVVVPDNAVDQVMNLGDKALEQAVASGDAKLVSSGTATGTNVVSIGRARKPSDVVGKQTLAVRPIAAG
ncbi:hypothetical protein F6X40_09955 [Paraburkholderia sp. UCT31]|uniref:hypothetical protein n=1 Tax=Paraburkholderia sp. UCT31 TaxID=2615209 RepID=UPI0016560169|nr:hypothetical protein [Paraburkholderia sp. UCT31]MBC8737130.1 hypothetical protein [Paraburkholderia sp. UCT31]